jgi:hypothetical protein
MIKKEGKPKFKKEKGEKTQPGEGPPPSFAPPPPPPQEEAAPPPPPPTGEAAPKVKKGGESRPKKGKGETPQQPCPEGMTALEDGSCVQTQ